MNYKQQIEQKAAEYGRMVGDGTGDIDLSNATCDAYLAGAEAMREIANTWISVNEDLPGKDHYEKCLWKDEKGHIWYGRAYQSQKPTHWKPITL